MSGPGKGPLKPDTSSHLKTSASRRSISQTILTVGNEGEGDEGQVGQCGTLEEGCWSQKAQQSLGSFLLCGKAMNCLFGLSYVAARPVRTLCFCSGPQEGLGSMETAASSHAPTLLESSSCCLPVECRELGSLGAVYCKAFLVSQPGAWIPAGKAR